MRKIALPNPVNLLLLLFLILSAQQIRESVSLKMAVVNGSGIPISGKVTVTAADGSVIYSGDSLRTIILNVHPGQYRFGFESGFYESVTRNIDAVQSDDFVVVTTRLRRFALETPTEPVAVTV